MDIHPQGGLHVGVAQDFGEGFDIHTVFDAPCGAGVPQDVEIPHRDFQPLQETPEPVFTGTSVSFSFIYCIALFHVHA